MQNMWGEPGTVGLVEYIKLTDYQYEGYMMVHDENNIIEYDNVKIENVTISVLQNISWNDISADILQMIPKRC